jgi:hypothetical protein
VFFGNLFFSLVSSPLRGGLRWGYSIPFDLTLSLSYEERELFSMI